MKRNKLLITALAASSIFLCCSQKAATGSVVYVGNGETKTLNSQDYSFISASDNGAVVYNYLGTLGISSSTFASNQSTDGYGGAIINFGTLTSNNDTFSSNTAYISGGAIQTENAAVVITSGLFSDNTATTGVGGAINQYCGTLTIYDTEFKENTSYSGGAVYSYGGTLTSSGNTYTANEANGGGAIYTYYTTAYIDGDTFKSNNASGDGGAIFNDTGSKLYISNESSFTSNTAYYYGGAIYNAATIDISSSTFTDNTATYGCGGAIENDGSATVSDSKFENNTAVFGGAIDNYNAVLNISGSSFTSNTASDNGGAIMNENSTVTVSDSTFTLNSSSNYGGAIQSYLSVLVADNVTFDTNTSTKGGAIGYEDNTTTYTSSITNSTFINNGASDKGGAIWILGGALDISGSTFQENSAYQGGAIASMINAEAPYVEAAVNISDSQFIDNTAATAGAIANFRTMNITDSTFTDNSATSTTDDEGGGALFLGSNSTTYISGSTFTSNTAAESGGAISTRSSAQNNSGAYLDIIDSVFTDNTAAVNGGAIYNAFYNSQDESGTVNVSGSTFTNNSATNGGAIYNAAQDATSTNYASISVSSSDFSGNSASSNGGAVYNGGTVAITDSSYTSNTAGSDGGAVYSSSTSSSLEISSSSFTSNSSGGNGGAVATLIDAEITDTSFTGNSAGGSGGAIYAAADLTISAENSDVTFSSNSASSGGDIYMAAANSALTLNSNEGTTMTFESGISGNSSGYTVNVNTDSTDTGTVVLNSTIENAAITTSYGTLHLAQTGALVNSTLTMSDNTTLNTINNYVETFGSELTLGSNVSILVDVDLGSGTADNYANATVTSAVISEINSIGSSTTENYLTINLYEATGLTSSQLTIADNAVVSNALTPIRWLQGSVDSNGILSYSPTGNSYNDFNPAVMASPVAAQMGGYLTQLNSYDEAFRNMDLHMALTKKQRQAIKNANKYAAADSSLVFSPLSTPYTEDAGWVRPYTTFESVGLKNGPKVSNVAYGIYGGLESEMYDLGNGWDGTYSIYAGYNGSHQAYQGNSIYQNGGTLGIVGMAYKENFFTGLTVNAGANAGQANTMYGNEDFSMLMAGIASKSGYNYELADGKFIVQPNFLMSYSFVNTFDYTNAAGVRIESDPLHAIQLEPGFKFIGNLENGWQPYTGVSVVWNIMDKTQFKANDTSLPELSVKPYVKYGAGIRKTWGKRFVGYLQTFLTNGGRNGIGIQTGFRWTLGKDPSKYTNSTGEKKSIKAKA